VEPRGWFVERQNDRPLRAFSGPFPGGIERRHVHPGIDISLPRGAPLVAVEAGKVVRLGKFEETGEKYLRLRIRPGVFAFYTHLRAFRCHQGDRVLRGQVIALSGNTGISTGPHLHFEIRRKVDDRLFRYNPRRLFEGGDLAGEPWILPDVAPATLQPLEDDMPPLISYRPGQVATVRLGAKVRVAPSPVAAVVRELDESEQQSVVGFVQGVPPANGSNRWLMWGAVPAFEYVHETDIEVLPAEPLPDCSEAATLAAAAAVAAATAGAPEAPGVDPVDDEDDEPPEVGL
jgi:murein DD-endopeptidase MepM/ murein hydrolase activator NlpD